MRLSGVLVGFLWLGCAGAVAAQAPLSPLSTARDLYASAAYEEAIAALDRLQKTASAATELEDQYRAFSLFALGRSAEAEAVAERLIRNNPLLELDGDASPRIVTMFTTVRMRLLPGLVRDRYRTAKQSLDRKDFAVAEPLLKTVKQMLDESVRIGATDEMTGDLGLLVDGFLGLIAGAAKPADARVADAATKSPGDASTPSAESGSRPAPPEHARGAPTSTSAAVLPTAPRPEPLVYRLGSRDVIPPVVIRQDAPAFPAQLATALTSGPKIGIIEVLIDEKGNVERAVMRESIHPVYDHLLLVDARKWKYRPAIKDEGEVKFLKMVAISVNTP